tara:strand:- start:2517 stop:3110 length:594 start_codon:yes stop_codon:yes gene_type:complete
MDKKINYEYFHWGPFLYKTKLLPEEIKQIKSLCKKDKKKDMRKTLAGVIKNEYSINEKKLFPIIFPYLDSYCKAAYKHYDILTVKKQITLKTAWVNFMKKHEYNPFHEHEGDLSFVLYTQIPKDLLEEYNSTITTSNSNPGTINFVINFGIKNFIDSHSLFPEIGDFYIFPANLVHLVNQFNCEGERISVSGNLIYA